MNRTGGASGRTACIVATVALWIATGAGCGRLGYTTVEPETVDGSGGTGGAGGTRQADASVAMGGVGGGMDAVGGTAVGTDGFGGGSGGGGTGGAGGTGGSVIPGNDGGVDRPADLPPDAPMPGTDAAADSCFGCPTSGVTILQTTATPVRGTSAGAELVASCLLKGALIGFEGTQARNQNYPWLQSTAGICGTITVIGSGSAAQVSITEADKLATLGTTSGSPWVRRCPANQVLVGFEGTAAGWMGTIGFRCASMLPAADGSFTLGPITTLPIAGAPSGSAFPTTDCPAGHVAVGEHLRSSTWLDGFGLICGKFVKSGP